MEEKEVVAEAKEAPKPKPKAKAKAKPKAKTVKVAEVTNLGKYHKRQPSSGIKLGVGETKTLVVDAWVTANVEAGNLKLEG